MPVEVRIKYPSQYETEVILKDGSRMRLRPIKREDTERWLAFISRLSPQTKYFRFHHIPRDLGMEDAVRYCTVDYKNTFAFVAEVLKDNDWGIVAIGRYYRLPHKNTAEVAFVIEDEYQGRGIGTRLMEWLANVARDNSITSFEADVLVDNEEMLTVFQDYGFHITSALEAGVYHVTFPIARTETVVVKEEERERSAILASLYPLLYPKSVAVIGASRTPGTIGYLLLECLMESRFSGVVYPVNPNAESVFSVKAYPSVLDVPDTVDVAIIAVPAPIVPKVADECGHKGVRALVVISDGFRERGPEGAEREKELRDIALGHCMRLVGPNCMGVINTDPQVNLNATFSRVYPPPGNIAFLSQSGALGLAILEYARNLNIGISTFISVGNRADISSNDMLQYWEQDSATRVILLYLESFGNPHRFGRIARRVSLSKPIVAVKSGSTMAGSRAASSHTGALATSEVASAALFSQAGILRVNTMQELFDVGALLSNQPIPSGNRVAIVTNGGGPGILAADACEHNGLTVPEFSSRTVEKLRPVVRREVGIHNPLDMTASATGAEYQDILKVLSTNDDIDAVLAIFVPPVVIDPEAIEKAIAQIAPVFQESGKPLLTCFMGQRGLKAQTGSQGRMVPSYPFPEDAISALAAATRYGEWLKKPKGSVPQLPGIDKARAQRVVEAALMRSTQRPLWLSPLEIAGVLDAYSIRMVGTVLVKTAAEAADEASRMGFPVAVKLASSTIVHKTDVDGVKLGLSSREEVERAFNDIRARLASLGREQEMEGAMVQRMVSGGIETIVGVTQDPSFGPLIMFGLGGIYTELLRDVAVKLHPLTDLDARELVHSIRMAKLFQGFRGSPPSDTASLEELLLRVSALVEDVPQIADMDLNPVKVMPQGQGYCVVDARIMIK